METRTNEGGSEVVAAGEERVAGIHTEIPKPAVNVEHVLDAWSTSAIGSQRFDRIRLERKDGEAFEALIDHETARDLGDKLTITAARLRYRSRGPSPIAEGASSPEAAGDEEDNARARKVLALLGLQPSDETSFFAVALVDEFRALREDRAKAFAMVDAVQKNVAQRDQQIVELRAELAGAK